MNFFDAKDTLELSDNFTPEELKKKYKKLAMEYHPDKCKDPSKAAHFIKVQQAYEFLNNDHRPVNNLNNFFGKIFKTFTPLYREILISPKEYLTGVTKVINIPINCNCTENLCKSCSGCGYSLNIFNLETCMDCLGNGVLKVCSCDNIQKINIIIDANPNIDDLIIVGQLKIKLKLDHTNYIFSKNKLYYTFDISLKESLIGFKKIFKDPFENEHIVYIKNTIIKQNDGYRINNFLFLLFNIIYPKKINTSLKKTLSTLDF